MEKIPVNPIAFGTLGGTFLSILPNLRLVNLLENIILAALGAAVSFGVSMFLKYLQKKHRSK